MNALLIITNSYDVTTDLLLDKLQGQPVFRFNCDQITRYQIRVDQHGFTISDPTGRTVSSDSVKKVYWRKPFNATSLGQEVWTKYVEAEVRYMLSELVNLLWSEQEMVLVEPFAERRTGMLLQLRHARTLFHVADYEFALNRISERSPAVVKSLSSELIDEKVMYTTQVSPEELDSRFPWFIQQLVQADKDVTVVFVRGQLFAFSLERDFLDRSVDWRRFSRPEQKWQAHSLPATMQEAIRVYMRTLRLDYGRLDFLLDAHNDRYWFCEVNPNGQFAWLDLDNEHGVLDAIVREISPASEIYAICNPHPLQRSG